MQGEGRRIETADGLGLFVREHAAVGPERGLPVLCLHGLTRNSRDFEDVLPKIAALGRRAIALDARGRGLSDRDPDPSRYAQPVYAQDVLRVLDALGVPRCAFVGTSMGGITTMILAAMSPQRIERVVLNDVGPVLSLEGLGRIMTYVGKAQPVSSWEEATDVAWSINGSAFPKAPPSFFARMARRLFRETAPGRIDADYDAAIAAVFSQPAGAAPVDMWPLFEALKPIPTLLVRGGLSDLLSVDAVAAMVTRKPDLEVVTARDVGHAPMLDEPDVWPTVARFLEADV